MFRTQEEKFLEEVAATAISRLLDWRDYLGLRLSKAWGMLSAKELAIMHFTNLVVIRPVGHPKQA